jgi:hypothetical protein
MLIQLKISLAVTSEKNENGKKNAAKKGVLGA